MDRHAHPVRAAQYEFRYQFLRVLPRPIHIIAASDDDGQAECLLVRQRHHLRRGLCRRVGVTRIHPRSLGAGRRALTEVRLSVNLIGRNVHEPPDRHAPPSPRAIRIVGSFHGGGGRGGGR